MHIGFDIKAAIFSASRDGKPITREALLQWEPRDRIGVVVDRPLGALDALLMLLLAGTAFYDLRPERRKRPLYPDMFLFHSGGPWGTHIAMDFVPDHKEVLVPADPAELLRAINHVGITHLLLPDRAETAVKHRFKEPEAALDRLKMCFAYGPDTVEQADIVIDAKPFASLADTIVGVLEPEAMIEKTEELIASQRRTSTTAGLRVTEADELERLLLIWRDRLSEVAEDAPDRLRWKGILQNALASDSLAQNYRTVSHQSALQML